METEKSEKGARIGTKRAAEILGVSEKSVRVFSDKGLLHPERLMNGHRLFRAKEVFALAIERSASDSLG